MFKHPKEVLILLLTITLWAASFSVLRVALRYCDPITLTTLRFGLGSVVFAPFLWRKRKDMKEKTLLRAFLIGICGGAGYHLLSAFGELWITASVTSLIVSLSPLFTAVFSFLIKEEQMNSANWIGMGIGALGVFFLVPIAFSSVAEESAQSTYLYLGLALIVCASFFWGIYTVLVKPVTKEIGPTEAAAVMTVSTFLVLSAPAGITLSLGTARIHFTWEFFFSLVFLGIISSAAAYFLWHRVLRTLQPTVVASFLYLEPLIAVVIGIFWLKEPVSWNLAAGGAMILIGTMFVQWGKEL